MRATFQREMDFIERHLAFLASTGSVSPYVGLFGTVWGIMHAFRSLANVQQATLAQVAPGIAEALVATAIGLLVAIPAVIAFNVFKGRVKQSVTDCQLLARLLLAQLKAIEAPAREAAEPLLAQPTRSCCRHRRMETQRAAPPS